MPDNGTFATGRSEVGEQNSLQGGPAYWALQRNCKGMIPTALLDLLEVRLELLRPVRNLLDPTVQLGKVS